MKSWMTAGCSLFLVGFTSAALSAPQDTPPASTPPLVTEQATDSAFPETPDLFGNADLDESTTMDLTQAAVKPLSGPKPLPANVQVAGPTAEIVKLASAGMQADVMLAFIRNCPERFNLSADQIVYLNDLGVPNSVVVAMLQHDQGTTPAAPALDYSTQPPPPASEPPQPPPAQTAPAVPPSDMAMAPPAAVPDQVEDPSFYDSLAPYGNWLDVEGYGPVWQPSVAVYNPVWQPYYDGGYWVNSDCGWYWMSDYSWGWAPFHYGRWFRHHNLGWCWAPGKIWSPAWVCWRTSDRFCGWAPLPPGAWYRPGVGLMFHGHRAGYGFDFGLSINAFAFADVAHFNSRHLSEHPLPRETATRFYRSSSVTAALSAGRHGIINHGVSASLVASASHSSVPRVAIRESRAANYASGRFDHLSRDGQALNVYRPRVTAAPRPSAATPARLRSDATSVGNQRNYYTSGRQPAGGPWGSSNPWRAGNGRVQAEARPREREEQPAPNLARSMGNAERPYAPAPRAMGEAQSHYSPSVRGQWQGGSSSWGRSSAPSVRSSEGEYSVRGSESSHYHSYSSPGFSSRSSEPSRSFSGPSAAPRYSAPSSSGSYSSSSRSAPSSSGSNSGSGRGDRNPR